MIRALRAAALLLVLAAGCRPADQIRSYSVPKESTPAPATATKPSDRMLAAILPDGHRAWFLKVVGPVAAIDRRATEIEQFFATVRAAPGEPLPGWQLPDDWQQSAGTGIRAATIVIPGGEEKLEMSVTVLPWSGRQEELLSNVNRWRDQMQLAPIDVAGLADCTRELKTGDVSLTIVDLAGKMGSTGMMPPFAQQAQRAGSSPSPTGTADSAAGATLPAGHPPVVSPGASDAAADDSWAFDAPDAWQPVAATGFRKAAFEIARGGATAKVTVTDFSTSAPMISDVLSNLNRWRGELGLAPVGDDVLPDVTEAIEVGGLAGTLVDVIPDAATPAESQVRQGTLAAMVVRGQSVWFFKLMGDRELVAAERENLRAFLKSVRFVPASGASDGD